MVYAFIDVSDKFTHEYYNEDEDVFVTTDKKAVMALEIDDKDEVCWEGDYCYPRQIQAYVTSFSGPLDMAIKLFESEYRKTHIVMNGKEGFTFTKS